MSHTPIILPNEIVFAEVEACIARHERITIPFRGRSMEPLLQEGCSITLAPLDRAAEVGDVVLFRHNGMHILHRIVAIDGKHITTQGDNCISKETVVATDLVALLNQVTFPDKQTLSCSSKEWARRSRRSLARKRARNLLLGCLGRKTRRWLSPAYFVLLALLMWAPMGVLGIPLNNFVLGIRLDHLIHASVFVPCALFLMDWLLGPGTPRSRRRWLLLWLCAILVGVTTESGQYLLPYRGFDINDLIANFLGATLGWWLLAVARRKA
ncbi:MAG: VanZ family protein [Bacteroidales bacterium]|nr:VanZ family protein [Bacteroidales bacterium]